MAEINPPFVIAGGSHDADLFRRALGSLIMAEGVVGINELIVAQNGTPDMSVVVSAGSAWIKGDEAGDQGYYFVTSDGPVNVPLDAADALNARHDLIVARVRDAQYSGGLSSWKLEPVTGVPAAVPVDPALPASSYLLASVNVPAAAGSIVNANITLRGHFMQGRSTAVGPSKTTGAAVTAGPTSGTVATKTITDPGYPYIVLASAGMLLQGTLDEAWDVQLKGQAGAVPGGGVLASVAVQMVGTGARGSGSIPMIPVAVASGDYTFQTIFTRAAGSNPASSFADATNWLSTLTLPWWV